MTVEAEEEEDPMNKGKNRRIRLDSQRYKVEEKDKAIKQDREDQKIFLTT